MQRESREFEIVLWGASGFTGALVAEYLAQVPGLRWAIAGRNRTKLEAVARELAAQVPGFDPASVPIVEASIDEPASLDRLAGSTRVVLSTVGPYALFGTDLVRACAEAGTDYCDLTGEVQWIHRMIAAFDGTARRSGARLVHCCGFDSVPFDMGVWYLQHERAARGLPAAEEVQGVVRRMRGSMSGGTFASLMNVMEEAAVDPAVRRIGGNANALLPPEMGAPRARAALGLGFSPALGVWTAPFVMATINTKILRRSNALLGFPWGKGFRYEESMATGGGFGGRLRAWVVTAGLGAFMAAAAAGPTRRLLKRVLPAPGEGPDRNARTSGRYEIDFFPAGENPTRPTLIATVAASLDPGYGSTSRMIAECALCLARDDVKAAGGSWTPSACMGEQLLPRLQQGAGLRFSVRQSS